MTLLYSLVNEIQNTTPSTSTKRQLWLLTRITDLFLAGSARYSEREIALFDEIFKTLVAVIELETRIKLARHYAIDPNAPSTLVRAFALDDAIAVAAPVLSRSNALSEADLVTCASTQSQAHLYAIAQRRTISPPVSAMLIERGETGVVHAVAKNPGASLSDDSFCELVLRSHDDAQLALHLGMRADIPRHHFLKLLETASVAVRDKIAAANPQLANAVPDAVTEVVDEINLEARNKSRRHAKAMKKVKRRKYWKELGETDVHAAARAQDFETTVLALSTLAGCSIELVERAVLSERPGTVQIVAKAAGCSWATAKALLLMTASERRLSKDDLEHARDNFEWLEIRTARRVLEFYEARRNAEPSQRIAQTEALGQPTHLTAHA